MVVRICGALVRLYAEERELPGHLDQGDLIREGGIGVGVGVALPEGGRGGGATPGSLSTMDCMASSLLGDFCVGYFRVPQNDG